MPLPPRQLSFVYPSADRPSPAASEMIAAKTIAAKMIAQSPHSPYFVTSEGTPWTPIGQNDAITWPEFAGLYKRRSLAEAESYFELLAAKGVTCLRLMLEYSQTGYRFFERANGSFNPLLVQLWDDIFALCRRFGLKLLLTPYDTFWMWKKWKLHPYNSLNGGPCNHRGSWLLCHGTRERIKRRLDFATERWGGDDTVFAWDLWNEIHPAHAQDSCEGIWDFISDISNHLRQSEQRLHGYTHLQTASVFLPVLEPNGLLEDTVLRHPCLDMANVHLYEHGTIDDPRNTVDAAVSTGRIIADIIRRATPGRPVFDSEHGPIHSFKDRHRTLSDDFDDEYFRHIQWAHLASGGAGGGMRWPNRHPHSLTLGMRNAQSVMAGFLPEIDWSNFQRETLTGSLRVSNPGMESFGCGDRNQAVVYLLRRDTLTRGGRLNASAPPVTATLGVPGLAPGHFRITSWDTERGRVDRWNVEHLSGKLFEVAVPAFVRDVALAIVRC